LHAERSDTCQGQIRKRETEALLFFPRYFLKMLAPKRITSAKSIIKMKKRTFAIDAAPAAIPPNPNNAAIIAIIKKIAAQRNIRIEFSDT